MRNKTTLFAVLLFALFANLAFAQTTTVSGIVKNAESGESLPGVAVVEKGTSNGTVTNFEGKFDLKVASLNSILVFSSMGMKPYEQKASASFMSVNLKMESSQLDEVVVTALGISREKKTLGYAVTNLDAEDLARSGENNVVQSLVAKVPGMQVTSSSGTPGASSKVLIRGSATFTGQNQPLIVIDGVPIDNSTNQSSPRDYPFNANLQGVNNSNRAVDINPDDIESVTVLKGPAAAALYGERAGNGAIIYTTKRGKAGKKGLGVKINSNVEISQVNKLPERQDIYATGLNGNFIPTADGLQGPDGIGGTADDLGDGTPNSWGPTLASQNIEGFDNYKNFFQNGVAWRNNIEVSGGNEKTGVRLGIGDLRQTGIVPNSEFNRTSVRLTADTYLSPKVKIGGTANYIRSTQIAPQNGSNIAGVMLSLLRMPNNFDVRNYQTAAGYNNNYFYLYDNPLYTAYENPFTSEVNRFLGNFYIDYKISNDFNFVYRLGTDAYADSRKQIFAISSQGSDNGLEGQINENRINSREIYGDAILSYNKQLNENFNFHARLGHNFRINQYNDLFARGRGLTIPKFYNLNNASDLYASQASQEVRSQAIFGEIGIDFKNYLYLSFTGRNEWSSTFELDNNNFFYPSASVSFVFSELFTMPEWFSFGKVRYSFAQVGISPVAYATRPLYTSPTYTDGFTNGLSVPYGGVNGFGLSNTLFSSSLQPERLNGNEIGLNVNLFKGLIDLDYTYYNQTSKDLLLYLPLPGSSGFQSSYTNSGAMVNKGHEVYLEIKPIRKENFTWTIGLNWAKNISEVTKLAPGVDEVSIEAAFASIGSFAIVGEPYGVFYGTLWQRDDNGNILIGANGRPLLESASGNIGNPIPNWLGGMRNTFEYKKWTLSFLLDFRDGGSIWNGTFGRLQNVGIASVTADRERTFTVAGVYAPGTMIAGQDVSGQANTTEISAQTYWRNVKGDAGGAAEEFVQEVNWFRLRDVSLGYSFDLRTKNVGIQYVNLSFTGRNLLLITNYNGVDPETSLTGAGSNINGMDYFNNPGTKSYMFGVAFGF